MILKDDMVIVDPDGNWKVFLEAKDGDYILLKHVTSVENAKSVMRNGFKCSQKNWTDSENGYVYLISGTYGLGTYTHYLTNVAAFNTFKLIG